ncbi:MAG: hypothetical protein WC793_01040 [Candidatus Paceibacterota bacterium]|jgi:hypothetical protein
MKEKNFVKIKITKVSKDLEEKSIYHLFEAIKKALPNINIQTYIYPGVIKECLPMVLKIDEINHKDLRKLRNSLRLEVEKLND